MCARQKRNGTHVEDEGQPWRGARLAPGGGLSPAPLADRRVGTHRKPRANKSKCGLRKRQCGRGRNEPGRLSHLVEGGRLLLCGAHRGHGPGSLARPTGRPRARHRRASEKDRGCRRTPRHDRRQLARAGAGGCSHGLHRVIRWGGAREKFEGECGGRSKMRCWLRGGRLIVRRHFRTIVAVTERQKAFSASTHSPSADSLECLGTPV